MPKVKCPKCKRVGTYSEKFSQCSACRYGYPKIVPDSSPDSQGVPYVPREAPKDVPMEVLRVETREKSRREPLVGGGSRSAAVGTFVGERPERQGVVREPVELVEGEPCPLCGKPVGRKKSTERVKKWRSEHE